MKHEYQAYDLMREVLEPMCAASSQKQVAQQLGFSGAYINDVLAGRRGISAALAKALGLRRVVVYRREG